MPDADDDWTIEIYVPAGSEPAALPERYDPAEDHTSLKRFFGFGRVEEVNAADVRGQWAKTVATVLELGATIRDQARGWAVEEMEVGLTLSASGKLLFIAEAGAEASIKLKLKRSPGAEATGASGPAQADA